MKEFLRGKKLGLALGGGAARGMAHIGVIQAFIDEGIKFDYIAGTSIGSMIGAAYAAGADWSKVRQGALDAKVTDLMRWKRGEFGYDSGTIREMVVNSIGEKDFSELEIPYAAVATNLNYGSERIFMTGNVADAVQASCLIPGLFVPVMDIDGSILVDGGVVNNIPSRIVREMGADFVFAVDLHGGLPEFDFQLETRPFEVLYATFLIVIRRNSVDGHRHANQLILPKLNKFPLYSLSGTEEMIEEGYKAAKKVLDSL